MVTLENLQIHNNRFAMAYNSTTVIRLLFVFIHCMLLSSAQCPDGCVCSEGETLMQCDDITAVPPTLPDTVKEVILENCMLNNLEQFPEDYENIILLIITSSKVSNVSDGAFSKLSQLRTLDLSNNPLSAVRSSMFTGLDSLVNLTLSGNTIAEFPSSILNMLPNLNRLTLSDNAGLRLQEDTFLNSGITELVMQNCGLSSAAVRYIQKATNLEDLNIGGNRLTTLEKHLFKDFNRLDTLHLDGCSIESIHDDAFEDLHSLKKLHLSYNKISSLDEDVFDDLDEQLEELYLQHNMLTTLSHEFLDLEKLLIVGLAGNPWECDCELAWTNNVQLHIDRGDNVTCATPSNLAGLYLKNATSSMECSCEYYDNCSDSGKIALYVGIPIIIVCALLIGYYIFKIIQTRKKNAANKPVRYSEVYRETTEDANKQPLV